MAPQKQPILVVEDDEEYRKLLVHVLEQSKFPVIPATSGSDAFKVIEHRRRLFGNPHIRLVLSDWKMPFGDGLELLNWMRSGAAADIPFILMSGAVTRAELLSAAKRGPDAVLLKPFRIEKLFSEIKNLTGLSAQNRRNFSAQEPSNDVLLELATDLVKNR